MVISLFSFVNFSPSAIETISRNYTNLEIDMQAFIGLTRGFWLRYDQLLEQLAYLGITTINEAEQICNESEMRMIQMAKNYWEKPETNLWKNVTLCR